MKNNLIPIIISQTLSDEVGGPAKTIKFFKKSLEGRVYSFNNINSKKSCTYIDVEINKIFFIYNPIKLFKLTKSIINNASLVSIHSYFGFHFLYVSILCCIFNIKFYIVPHGAFDTYTMSSNSIVKKIYIFFTKYFINKSKGIISASKYEAEQVKKILKTKAKIHNIFWPVASNKDCEWISTLKEKNNTQDKPSILHLLYLGRLNPMKRIDKVIELAKELSKHIPCELNIVGNEDGISQEDIRKWSKNSINLKINFHGPVYGKDKWNFFINSHLFISASERENFNHTAAEALLSGIPVILSKGNALRNIVLQNNVGFCFEDFRLNDYLSAYPNINKRCRKFAISNFSEESFKNNIRSIYYAK